MNNNSPFLRRCLLLLPLALMVASVSGAQGFESRIFFSSNRDGDWDIYSMDVNGDNVVQCTDHPATDEYPAASPDGRRIAFISERGVTRDLYVMDSDGGNVVRLTRDKVREGRPSWTPDGTRIAFSSTRFPVGDPDNSEIYMMDADGNNVINLTNHKWHDLRPSWSPDGRKMAFVSFRTGFFKDPRHIFVMNADGEERRNLTRDTNLRVNSNPSWSPDGRKIAFHSQPNFKGYDIYVITAEGENLERLTEEGDNRFPAYSPDGTKIAFASTRDGDYHIYLMDTNGMDVVKLTNTPHGTDNVFPSWPHGGLAVTRTGKLPTSWGEIKRTRNP